MLMRDAKRFAFQLDKLSILQDDKALAALAEKYKPKEGINYVAFTFHATAPEVNMKAMAITPPTMQNSRDSAIHMMIDFEHRAEDLPMLRDDEGYETEVMGHIVELSMEEVPDANDGDAWLLPPYIPKEPIISSGIMALFTRIFKVKMIAAEVNRGAPWYFSLEIGERCSDPAIWLQGTDDKPHKIIEWAEATEELRQIASQPKMMEYEGQSVAYLMGGADGHVPFIGGAITRNPAGYEQRQPGRSLMLVASADGVIQDSATDKIWKSEEWKKQITASLKNRKEASNRTEGSSGITGPLMITDLEELLEVAAVVTGLAGSDNDQDDTGGENTVAKVEIEQADLDKQIADAKAAGKAEGDTEGYARGKAEIDTESVLNDAVEAGTHIPAENVDGIVEKRLMSTSRKTRIESLPCDDDTKADFLSIASNEDRYPLDADGETKFAESFTRWEASMKTASDDTGDGGDGKGDGGDGKGDKGSDDTGDGGKGADDKKTAGGAGDKKEFDPGSGGGGSDGGAMDELPKMEI
jgi:hypothetical protein